MFKKLSALALAGALILTGASSSFAYTVQSGDTMYNIAKQNSMSLSELASINPSIKNLDLIYVGQNVNTSENKTTQVKSVSKAVSKPVETVSDVTNASAYEVDLMAKLVRAEAQGESYTGKVAVANVVLNRVNSSQFPNSIQGVIYQSGQFSPVSNGKINVSADADSIKAVKEALNGKSVVSSDTVFFYNSRTATSRWLDSRQTTGVIGNHTFKR